MIEVVSDDEADGCCCRVKEGNSGRETRAGSTVDNAATTDVWANADGECGNGIETRVGFWLEKKG